MLSNIHLPPHSAALTVPDKALFTLPEKVLQFGTGVLLRGLPDYYIDKANRAGLFNGRVAVVKSTEKNLTDHFKEQDNLYTIHIRGIADGNDVEEQVICSAISRVLSAAYEWEDVLQTARSKDLQIVISNTTEVGIVYVEETVTAGCPNSFPGKLLAVLYERYRFFGNDESAGLVIIPTELIIDNAKVLKGIVLKLAAFNCLEQEFISWVSSANSFCNSLVDRIVPGKPAPNLQAELDNALGYQDKLRIVAEPYSLWAIEGGPAIRETLSFCQADSGMVITADIRQYREIKLRLLNGTHTLSCALAVLSGFNTVDEAMANTAFRRFISQLMNKEISPAIPYPVDADEKRKFISSVTDRFSNPHIKHQWLSIAAEYSAKMRMRVLPLLLNYQKLFDTVPEITALGFAAFIRLMKVSAEGTDFKGTYSGRNYMITDSNAAVFCKAWENGTHQDVVDRIFNDMDLWGADLSSLGLFKQKVIQALDNIEEYGALCLTEQLVS